MSGRCHAHRPDTRNTLYNVKWREESNGVAGSVLRRFECGRCPVSTLFNSPGVQGNDPIAQGRVLEIEGTTDRSSELREVPEYSEVTVSWCF